MKPAGSSDPDLLQELPARRGFSVFYRGKTLLSRIDPVAQGERLAAEIPVKERTLYFCPSPIYGYGLSLLLEKLRTDPKIKNSAVLCVEADEKLFEISRNALAELTADTGNAELPARASNGEAGLSRDSGGDKILALVKVREPVSSPEDICAFVRQTWGERQFRRVEELRLTGGWQLFPELYEELAWILRKEIAVEWGNALTLIRLGRLYARNLIRNLALLPETENISVPYFGETPVLVLGAGPSLDTVLDELAALWGGKIPAPETRRFKIVCVDTCIPALHERGIAPDLAMILESQHWNLRDFTGSRDWGIDAVLDLSALPSSARVLGGKRFFFATPWTDIRLIRRLEEEGLLPETFAPMGSVGLSAVALALRSGAGPVLTAGLDFSYTLDAYHARSTPGYSEQAREQNRFRSIINTAAAFREGSFTALSKTGAPVRSDPSMRNYRNIFEQEFGGKAGANPRLMDITGPGLPLGIKTISVNEAFAVLNDSVSMAHNITGAGLKEKITAPRIIEFVRREKEALETLKAILTGAKKPEQDQFEELIDASDYLWAHFPECAGAGGRRPPLTDSGFLKRIRTEIDPFLRLWEMTLGELEKINTSAH